MSRIKIIQKNTKPSIQNLAKQHNCSEDFVIQALKMQKIKPTKGLNKIDKNQLILDLDLLFFLETHAKDRVFIIDTSSVIEGPYLKRLTKAIRYFSDKLGYNCKFVLPKVVLSELNDQYLIKDDKTKGYIQKGFDVFDKLVKKGYCDIWDTDKKYSAVIADAAIIGYCKKHKEKKRLFVITQDRSLTRDIVTTINDLDSIHKVIVRRFNEHGNLKCTSNLLDKK